MFEKLFTKKAPDPAAYDRAVLEVLLMEFSHSNRADIDDQIRQRLQRERLGPWDEERIERLRRLKDDLQSEISPIHPSHFKREGGGEYAKIEDWDRGALLEHFKLRHPQVSERALEDILVRAIYYYYLR